MRDSTTSKNVSEGLSRLLTVNLHLTGDVQGIGLRPQVARLAQQHQLGGTVRNCSTGIEISLIGEQAAIDSFMRHLSELVPYTEISLQSVDSTTAACSPGKFEITDSRLDGPPCFVIPLDRVTCAACLAECLDSADRRYHYPLISCAKCGPRYTILQAMPYDRARTSMNAYTMCAACLDEYADPLQRRYHAQNNCCSTCGPRVRFTSAAMETDDQFKAVDMASGALHDGAILALKGLGGYQLVCDATNAATIARLRCSKRRPTKPLAVMVDSLETAQRLAHVAPVEQAVLTSPAGPIVIVSRKPRQPLHEQLATNVHPGLGQVGLMLPTTALHWLLLRQLNRPLIVTSGNVDGEPLEFREQEAVQQLGELVDGFLHHDRPIVRPIDDSVVRCMVGRPVTLRAARGLAPIPLQCDSHLNLLAVGGQQKAAVAVANGATTYLGPHIGELDSAGSRLRYYDQSTALRGLLHAGADTIAHDLHPDYVSTQWADSQVDIPRMAVQHHHAHIVAGMLQCGWLDQRVLGFAFDGTGAGSDGTIWGGEVLVATATSFQRVAHVRSFRLPGGAAAIRQPWRVAVALLDQATGLDDSALDDSALDDTAIASLLAQDLQQVRQVRQLLNSAALSPETTSMGRLFDGVASIVCGMHHSSYEGEAAIRLENAAISDCYESDAPRDMSLWPPARPSDIANFDWRPLVAGLVAGRLQGDSTQQLAAAFHNAVAAWVVRLAQQYSDLPIVLSGGVFQNRLLVELIADALREHSAPVGLPGAIPPNDGGLAAGQLAIAARSLSRSQ